MWWGQWVWWKKTYCLCTPTRETFVAQRWWKEPPLTLKPCPLEGDTFFLTQSETFPWLCYISNFVCAGVHPGVSAVWVLVVESCSHAHNCIAIIAQNYIRLVKTEPIGWTFVSNWQIRLKTKINPTTLQRCKFSPPDCIDIKTFLILLQPTLAVPAGQKWATVIDCDLW